MLTGFYKEVKLGALTVIIDFESSPYSEENSNYLFGYPLGQNRERLTGENVNELINSIEGYFLFLFISSDKIILANDICGGFRLYHCRTGDTIYISDRYQSPVKVLAAQELPERDDREYSLWKRQRYTSGGRTFVKGLNKIPPSNIVCIDSGGMSSSLYYKDIVATPYRRSHTNACHERLTASLELLKKESGKKLLFFSGGSDSTLLALLMQKLEIEFTLVFLLAEPKLSSNYRDYQRAVAVARRIGLNLDVVEVNVEEGLEKLPDITSRTLFDRHFSILHFEGAKRLAERFGTDTIFVSGQGADSILSFGPSARTKGDLAARVLLRWPGSVMAKFAAMAVKRKHSNGLRLPNDDNEFLAAFLNPREYYTMVDDDCDQTLTSYLQSLIKPITNVLTEPLSLLMYLKIYGFVQGSDNQVVIQSAKQAGVTKVFLPFATPGFIFETVKFQSRLFETVSPKYVVTDILKQLGYQQPEFSQPIVRHDTGHETLLAGKVDEHFEKVSALIFQQSETEFAEQK